MKNSSFLVSQLAVAVIAASAYACGSSGDATTSDGSGDGGSSGSDGGVGGGGDGSQGSGDGASGQGDGASANGDGSSGGGAKIEKLFVITMENHSWSDIKGSSSAPYINGTLMTMAAHAEQYFTPPNNHPSEPNYIWMEAASNLGITTDDDPSKNHQSTTDHLVSALGIAGKSWKAYVENIDGNTCPLTTSGLYAPKHLPMVFFDDVTNGQQANSQTCISHVRPYTELATDLSGNKTADYNFITPNLCDDMHGTTGSFDCPVIGTNLIQSGDTFLSKLVPQIMGSNDYKNGGAIFIVFDEGSGFPTGSDGPIPFFAIGANVKPGFASQTKYTHSSLVRSVQEIFGSAPFIRDAANAKDFGDMFNSFP